jgi:CRP-like cAMP-binding protein
MEICLRGVAPISNAFIDKISGHAPISSDDVRLLNAACQNQRVFPARTDLIREGDTPGPEFVILEGWACRYKLLAEGTRQITAFLMPGDSCELHASVSDCMEHSIATLTKARIALVPRGTLQTLLETRPAIMRAYQWNQLVIEDTLRAWIVSMGRRNSVQRVAHLMCELYVRAHNVGLTQGDRFELPLTQTVIGDALGLTPIHVNRVLRQLRISGVMALDRGALVITDIGNLATVAGFDDTYLHRRIALASPGRRATRH